MAFQDGVSALERCPGRGSYQRGWFIIISRSRQEVAGSYSKLILEGLISVHHAQKRKLSAETERIERNGDKCHGKGWNRLDIWERGACTLVQACNLYSNLCVPIPSKAVRSEIKRAISNLIVVRTTQILTAKVRWKTSQFWTRLFRNQAQTPFSARGIENRNPRSQQQPNFYCSQDLNPENIPPSPHQKRHFHWVIRRHSLGKRAELLSVSFNWSSA